MFIRNATIKDTRDIINLMHQMGYTLNTEIVKERIKKFQKPLHQILISEHNSQIVGLIAFACYEHFRLNGRCLHIDTLVVDHKARGLGIGKKLIHMAEKYAIEHGCVTIELITSNHRRKDGTHDFYQAIGYIDQQERNRTYFSKVHDELTSTN